MSVVFGKEGSKSPRGTVHYFVLVQIIYICLQQYDTVLLLYPLLLEESEPSLYCEM